MRKDSMESLESHQGLINIPSSSVLHLEEGPAPILMVQVIALTSMFQVTIWGWVGGGERPSIFSFFFFLKRL